MTKKLKISLISILSALVLLVAGFLAFPKARSASADATWKEMSDNHFSFESNVELFPTVGQSIPYGLTFRLNLKNPAHENLLTYYSHGDNWWNNANQSVFSYNFTVYSVNEDGENSTKLKSYRVCYGYAGAGNYGNYLIRIISEKEHAYYAEGITIDPGQGVDGNNTGLSNYKDFRIYSQATSGGYTVSDFSFLHRYDSLENTFGQYTGSSYGLTFAEDEYDNSKYIDVRLNAASPYKKYFVQFDYHYEWMDAAMFYTNYITGANGSLQSPESSLYDVFKYQYDMGELTEDLPSYTWGMDVIRNANVQRVQIKYLKQIGNTPFAEPVYQYVDVPVVNQVIYPADVYDALGVDSLKCLESHCINFEYKDDVYVAHYLKNVWLRAITEEGNYMDYFLDINQSFEQYYYQFVEDGIISMDLYEWIYSAKLISKYPELEGRLYENVYGYFGIVFTPQSHSFDTAFKAMFDISTSTTGIIKNFSYDVQLPKAKYDTLLNEYDYSWLARVWNNVWETVEDNANATCYVFYSEPGTNSGVIGEGGQDKPNDTNGIIGGAIGDVTSTVGDFIGGIWDFGSGILDGVGNVLGGLGGFLSSGWGMGGTILAIGAIIIIVVIIKNRGSKK